MKNFYLAVTEQHNGKYRSYFIRYANCNNLLSTLKQCTKPCTVNVFDVKREAEETVLKWNEAFKSNGTFWEY